MKSWTIWECVDCGDLIGRCSHSRRRPIEVIPIVEGADLVLGLTEEEALAVHHSLSTTVDLMDQVGESNIPPHAPLKGRRPNLIQVARRLDHERRHKGAVPNPNGPVGVGS